MHDDCEFNDNLVHRSRNHPKAIAVLSLIAFLTVILIILCMLGLFDKSTVGSMMRPTVMFLSEFVRGPVWGGVNWALDFLWRMWAPIIMLTGIVGGFLFNGKDRTDRRGKIGAMIAQHVLMFSVIMMLVGSHKVSVVIHEISSAHSPAEAVREFPYLFVKGIFEITAPGVIAMMAIVAGMLLRKAVNCSREAGWIS